MALDPRKLNPALARPFVMQIQGTITVLSALNQPQVQRVVSTHKFIITSIGPVWGRDPAAATLLQEELYAMTTLQLRLTERGSNIPIMENISMDAFFGLGGEVREHDLKIPVAMNPGADIQLQLTFTDAGVIYAAIPMTVVKNVGLLLKGHLVAPE